MAGPSSACSPDSTPAIFLCREPVDDIGTVPAWLTDYERDVVGRFGGPRRREYLTSRWLLRQAIAGASGMPASQCRPVDGRPVASQAPAGWRLSLSHSQGLSACAAGNRGPLGLDIEPCTRRPQWQRVARRWFSQREQDWLLADDDAETFLLAWTLKEAWLKATGRGIAGNLQSLEVGPGFQLRGDQPEQDWRAICYRVQDFLVSLVYQAPAEGTDRPDLRQLSAPEAALPMTACLALSESPQPILERAILAAGGA